MNYLLADTNSGKIQGYERDGMIEYLGIPYAKPPIGDLRLKRAQPMTPWEGVFEAKEYGEPSIQFHEGKMIGSEDCLTLNIRRPLEGDNLPVLVFIHGGGYNTGSASDGLCDGKSFVRHGILYISIQYRLNVWGFYDFTPYPGCENYESNCGISDHILAMQWIHDNVEAFGGNPDQVTISGESAGGTSVTTLMAIPSVKGTFQQAIASSALPNALFSHEMNKENIDLFMEGMDWNPEDLSKLADIDPFEVLKGNEYMGEKHQYKNPGIFLPSPIIDDLIPIRPIEAIKNGSAEGVKLMIGTNLHEGTMFVRPEKTNFPNSWEMIEEMFRINGYSDKFSAVKKHYETGSSEMINGIEKIFIDFATDYAFQMPALQVAEAQRNHGDVWMYRFEFMTKKSIEVGLLSAHAMDLPFDFNNLDFGFGQFLLDGEPKEVGEKLADEVHMSWVEFIKNGNLAEEVWPQYTGYDSPIRIYDRETKVSLLNRTKLMEVWDGIEFYQKCEKDI